MDPRPELTLDEEQGLKYINKHIERFKRNLNYNDMSDSQRPILKKLEEKEYIHIKEDGEIVIVEVEIPDPMERLNENLETLIKEVRKLNDNIRITFTKDLTLPERRKLIERGLRGKS